MDVIHYLAARPDVSPAPESDMVEITWLRNGPGEFFTIWITNERAAELMDGLAAVLAPNEEKEVKNG